MIKFMPKPYIIFAMAIGALTACSQGDVELDSPATEAESKPAFQYQAMENYSHEMAEFLGLVEGESFAESEIKINAVFKAYDGHEDPLDIRMDSSTVEAGWKQILVTQEGLLDGAVTAQQLLAVFDDEKKLVSYGMRIKCHNDSGVSKWQAIACQ